MAEESEKLTGGSVSHSYLSDDTLKCTERWGGMVTLYYTADKKEKGLKGKVRPSFHHIFSSKMMRPVTHKQCAAFLPPSSTSTATTSTACSAAASSE